MIGLVLKAEVVKMDFWRIFLGVGCVCALRFTLAWLMERIIKPRTVGLPERTQQTMAMQPQQNQQYGNFAAQQQMPYQTQQMPTMQMPMQGNMMQQQQHQPPNMQQCGGNMMAMPMQQGTMMQQHVTQRYCMPTNQWGIQGGYKFM